MNKHVFFGLVWLMEPDGMKRRKDIALNNWTFGLEKEKKNTTLRNKKIEYGDQNTQPIHC